MDFTLSLQRNSITSIICFTRFDYVNDSVASPSPCLISQTEWVESIWKRVCNWNLQVSASADFQIQRQNTNLKAIFMLKNIHANRMLQHMAFEKVTIVLKCVVLKEHKLHQICHYLDCSFSVVRADGHDCPPFWGASQVYIIDWEHYLSGLQGRMISLGVQWATV